jgi:hypothetical protein
MRPTIVAIGISTDIPVGIIWLSPGFKITDSSIQADKSSPAEPVVAYDGIGGQYPEAVWISLTLTPIFSTNDKHTLP